jgi:hypothetical protein
MTPLRLLDELWRTSFTLMASAPAGAPVDGDRPVFRSIDGQAIWSRWLQSRRPPNPEIHRREAGGVRQLAANRTQAALVAPGMAGAVA